MSDPPTSSLLRQHAPDGVAKCASDAEDGDEELAGPEEDNPGGVGMEVRYSSPTGSSATSPSKPLCKIPWRGCLALLGGFLIQLTLGSFYSFGNMMTYMTSYMR